MLAERNWMAHRPSRYLEGSDLLPAVTPSLFRLASELPTPSTLVGRSVASDLRYLANQSNTN